MTPDEIIEKREALGLTQAQLAHRIGVSHTTVWRWEAGQSSPSRLAETAIRKLRAKA